VLVEHDMRVVAASDWVVDLGPGAGREGGQVLVCDTPQCLAASPRGRTAQYLQQALRGALQGA
jgi:excinuclease ABC subunit A